MINFQTKKVRQGINKAYLKVNVKQGDLNTFKDEATTYLNNLKQAQGESEEHFKGYLKDFLQDAFYSNAEKLINTSDRIDLAIYSGKSKSTSVDVIIEAKRPDNKSEMISKDKLNQKAFQEALHYYFDEREKGNDSIKQVVITNYTEFFIFDAQEIERLFYSKKKLVKTYKEWQNDGKVSGKTEFIYGKFEEFIKNSEGTLTGIYADLNNYKKQLSTTGDEDTDKKLIPLYKLFSPEHLTKKSFANDSNSLDKGFYNELLHILGLQEVKEGSKRLIQRLSEDDRNTGSLVENTIATLKYDQHMNEVRDAKIQYGDSEDDQLFGVALELVITWVNRVLFLKLLEAQLLAYHKFDEKFKFLVFEGIIDEYDELNKLFFRVLALKNNDRPESLQKRFGHIPYLNSSLFDSTTLEKKTIQISGLDDKASLPIYNRSVFRKSANPPKGSLNTLEYLLRFLDAYNFSAESSGGIQKEDKALINASVLGLIFEKINGYKDGSFFTPGFITEYMARETLRKSVVDKLNEAFDWDCKEFNELHRKVESTSLEEVNAVINSITICDPAVGSGHFLVSCLNELLAIKAELKVLCDVEGKRIPYLDIEVENDELAIEYEGELFEYKVNHEWKNGNVERSHAGQERQRIQKALFHEKRFLIEHCLFGVDINPNSVKICRLRLWIELLKHAYYKDSSSAQTLNQVQGDVNDGVDKGKTDHAEPDTESSSAQVSASVEASKEKYVPFSELEVLPNIDINIKQGNSLVSRFGLDEDLTAIFKKSEHSLEDYKQAVKNYRETRDRSEKQRLQKLINDIKAEYSETLLNNKPINKKLSKERGKLELMQNEDLFGGGKATKKELTKQQKKVTKLEEQKAEEEAGAFYREAFEWRFEFPEVLDDQGNYKGFDVVIGNPPYYQIQKMKEDISKLKNSFTTYEQSGDIYALFYERGNQIISKNGRLSYITSNKWMRANYGKSLRNYLVQSTSCYQLIDFNYYQVFDEASVDTNILSFRNGSTKKIEQAVLVKEDFKIEEIPSYVTNNSLELYELSDSYWNIVSEEVNNLNTKLISSGIKLKKWNFEINRGVLTGLNEAFVIDEETRNTLVKKDPKNNDIIVPYLRGRDIRRFGFEHQKLWLINSHNGIKEKNVNPINLDKEYPTVFKYLSQFKDKAEKRSDQGDNWYNLRNCAYLEDFKKHKLVYAETMRIHKSDRANFPRFGFDTEGYFCDKTTFIATGEHLKYLLGFMNSKIGEYLIKEFVTKLDTGGYMMQKVFIEEIPVFKTPKHEKISSKVDQILTIKKQNPETDTSKLEAEIDQMVYELYGLTEEEIAIVEESVG
jgi:adenine-specific DNA-methyltransferase